VPAHHGEALEQEGAEAEAARGIPTAGLTTAIARAVSARRMPGHTPSDNMNGTTRKPRQVHLATTWPGHGATILDSQRNDCDRLLIRPPSNQLIPSILLSSVPANRVSVVGTEGSAAVPMPSVEEQAMMMLVSAVAGKSGLGKMGVPANGEGSNAGDDGRRPGSRLAAVGHGGHASGSGRATPTSAPRAGGVARA
jgi:hypothetical protein